MAQSRCYGSAKWKERQDRMEASREYFKKGMPHGMFWAISEQVMSVNFIF